MTSVNVALWRVNSVQLPNGTPQSKLKSLSDQIDVAFKGKPAVDLRIFVVAEFYFMNCNGGESGIRWYTNDEKNAVVTQLQALSKNYGGILLVGGTICWAETKKKWKLKKKKHWYVYNEAPVIYNGITLNMYGKHLGGGEVSASDNLRLYKARRGAIDRTINVRSAQDNPDGTARYEQQVRNDPLDSIHSMKGQKIKQGTLAVAPGVDTAYERYEDRIHFKPGSTSGAFKLNDLNLTGGVEVCQEHNQAVLKTTMAQAGNLHILTANSVSYNAASVHLADPGLFIHCDPLEKARAVINNGGVTDVADTAWDDCNGSLAQASLNF